MPYPVTHILVAVILVELFRKYYIKDNKKFPRYYILIAAIGGILPDLDIWLFYILYFFGYTLEQIHRTFMHSLFIPVILGFAGIFISKISIKSPELRKRHIKIPVIFFILSIGSFVHIVLDLIPGTATIFYPIINTSIGLNVLGNLPSVFEYLILPSIDGILLIFWFFWMEFKLKINEYF